MTRICGNLHFLGYRRCYGQREAELCAAPCGILDPDSLPMRLDEGLGDGQTQPGAGVARAAGEELEDLAAALWADTGTAVGDRHLDHLRATERAADRDGVVLRAVPDGVLQQVGQHA